ncbi:hypothetical protein J6590_082449 [Homalodisca vitripennis]|nr:hypothetical protein J6590_082449 [Homalodisca vitripennis]
MGAMTLTLEYVAGMSDEFPWKGRLLTGNGEGGVGADPAVSAADRSRVDYDNAFIATG